MHVIFYESQTQVKLLFSLWDVSGLFVKCSEFLQLFLHRNYTKKSQHFKFAICIQWHRLFEIVRLCFKQSYSKQYLKITPHFHSYISIGTIQRVLFLGMKLVHFIGWFQQQQIESYLQKRDGICLSVFYQQFMFFRFEFIRCLYTYIYIYMHMYTYVCTYINKKTMGIDKGMHIYTCMCVHICLYVCMYLCKLFMFWGIVLSIFLWCLLICKQFVHPWFKQSGVFLFSLFLRIVSYYTFIECNSYQKVNSLLVYQFC
eukprot:TRINITY_DN13366_c0_g3_i2.p1 TRINITY_DN13366_c0_g3~~TRINITY_DN13366_c0_g3_i2.p1  ORF type:complete len:257 (-),score=-26.79 TRINITY_DN13366_c0_g3_i2:265-1035(-)